MTNLRELNSAVQNATYPGHEFAQAVREVVAAIVERMEPAKTETPICAECYREFEEEAIRFGQVTLPTPASEAPLSETRTMGNVQPTPTAPSEMPEAKFIPTPSVYPPAGVGMSTTFQVAPASEGAKPYTIAELVAVAQRQPAPVRMTEELERVLEAAEMAGDHYGDDELLKACRIVRAHAAQPQPVTLPKVQGLLREWMDYEPLPDSDDGYFNLWERAQEMLAELDAAEGKVTG